MNKVLIVLLCLILLILLILAPWITKDYAENIVHQKFISEWRGVMDGCGFDCEGCGIKESRKTLFGYTIKIEYICGMKPEHRTETVYVSLFGTIHGLPKP